jgi:putative hemolysin
MNLSHETNYPQNPENKDLIDLRRVIGAKNPHLMKIMPGFIFHYLEKIIHVKEVNVIVAKNKHLWNLDFINAIVKDFGFDIYTKGEENIIGSGRAIVASNHPFGGPDGLAMMHVTGKYRPDIKIIVNDIVLNIENINNFFVPVNKHGSNTKDMISLQDSVYASDALVLTFPFGLVSRKRGKVIEDLEWKKSFMTKARHHKRDIIPAFISGRNSNFFYRLANLRKFLGIKSNIEMLYLVDEFFKHKDMGVEIVFGKPIPWQTFDNRHNDAEWAEKLRKHVYTLSSDPQNSFMNS